MRGHLGYTILVTDKVVYERFQADGSSTLECLSLFHEQRLEEPPRIEQRLKMQIFGD